MKQTENVKKKKLGVGAILGDGTQGLTFARQALYHLNHAPFPPPTPLALAIFEMCQGLA
jgi:hypothetical protein